MSKFIFKPFNLEAQNFVSGYHDTEKISYDLASIETRATIMHERIHEQLLTESPDGQLLTFLLKIYNHNKERLTNIEKQNLDEILEQIMESSQDSQEIAATYLGVKVLPIEEHSMLFANLPSIYQNYYKYFSDVLDSKFNSTYLQYLIGWNISVVAFSSKALQRFIIDIENPLLSKFIMQEFESPNYRLKVIIDSFNTHYSTKLLSILQDITNQTCSKLRISSWDINSEIEWIQNSENNSKIEIAISHYFRPWLCSISELPVLINDECTITLNKMGIWLNDKYSINIKVGYDWREKEISDGYKEVRGKLASKVNIDNPKYRELENIDYCIDYEDLTENHRIIIVRNEGDERDESNEDKNWNLFTFKLIENNKIEKTEFGSLSHNKLIDWFCYWQYQYNSNKGVPGITACCCKINDIFLNIDFIFKLMEYLHLSLGASNYEEMQSGKIKTFPMFYCLDGDWINELELLSEMYQGQNIEFQRFPLMRNQYDKDYYMRIHVVQIIGIGYFFKIFPKVLTEEVSFLEEIFINENKFVYMEENTSINLLNYFLMLFPNIQISWKSW